MIARKYKRKKHFILNPIILLIGFNSYAQNMQLADLYLTYNPSRTAIIPFDNQTDLIATSWLHDNKFYPDHQNFNYSVENTNDAFVVWQEAQNHQYIQHIRLSGDSSQNIERIWVSKSKDIFIVLSSSKSDSISLTGSGNLIRISQPEMGNQGLCYFLIKLNRIGKYQDHMFLGYYNNNSLSFLYPNHIDSSIPLRMYYSDSIHKIPGTSIKLITPRNETKTVSFEINCLSLKTGNIKFRDLITSPTRVFGYGYNYSNNVETRYISKANSQHYPDSISCLVRYNDHDSLVASRNISFGSNAAVGDTLYLSHTSTDSNEYSINNYKFPADVRYISKWVEGKLVDSMTISLHVANFFVDKSKQLYFYGYGSSPDSQLVRINFLKGHPYLLKDDQVFRFWGPIENDSLKWISHIAGNLGLGVSPFYFYADSNAQYFQSNVKSWMDLDPGPYEWQFSPSKYNNRSVIAKYNCFPNAIFTLDQTAQKVQFYNFSSGGVTYKWLFGVGSANSTDLNPIFKYPAVGDYDVTLIAYNDCGSDTFTFPVTVDEMISVNDLHVQDVRIYPNPASKNVTIEHDLTNGSIVLLDLTGKTIWTGKLENITMTFDVSSLYPGLYIVLLKEGSITVTRKLVVL